MIDSDERIFECYREASSLIMQYDKGLVDMDTAISTVQDQFNIPKRLDAASIFWKVTLALSEPDPCICLHDATKHLRVNTLDYQSKCYHNEQSDVCPCDNFTPLPRTHRRAL